jgi:DNA end-binding protein Ku
MGTTLHHNYEVRSDSTYFEDIPNLEIGKEMLDLASHIVETKKASFDPEQFKDRYQEAVVDLIRSKRAGRPVQVAQVPDQAMLSTLWTLCGVASGRRRALS